MCFFSKSVVLHIEKFNARPALYHIAIEFEDVFQNKKRYDFRPGTVHRTYLTTITQRNDIQLLMPDLWPENYQDVYMEYRTNMDLFSKTIYWGKTQKTWDEIVNFEKQYLCKKYILGYYDCRHYVSNFAMFTTGNRTPIWTLNSLYESI